MIVIGKDVVKQQKNFWNNALFHPTDAVEDAWGKRILDRLAADKAVQTVRIYTMFEDIVLMDEDGRLTYDFRLADLRLDYLLEKGFKILLAYGMMPECIASNKTSVSSVSKNKTRYKGKMINTSPPTDYNLWEEICYAFTKHILDRYGEKTVSQWRLQCFNEPNLSAFFMTDTPKTDIAARVREYSKLYEGFARGILRASDKLRIGGPAYAISKNKGFLSGFLDYVKAHELRLDFISVHNYSHLSAKYIAEGETFSVNRWLREQQALYDEIAEHGFTDTELIVDEWGMAAQGFYNVEECPAYIARETEVFSAYYVKLIYRILEKGWNIPMLMICLSGQHEMVTDFSGFRNFFTLNFIQKPIYSAYILASKLYEGLTAVKSDNDNVFVISSKDRSGRYAALISYSSEYFEEDLPEITEKLRFEEDVTGKKATVYCIDRSTTNPYRLYQKMGCPEMTEDVLKVLREEGKVKPVTSFAIEGPIELRLTPNSVYLIQLD